MSFIFVYLQNRSDSSEKFSSTAAILSKLNHMIYNSLFSQFGSIEARNLSSPSLWCPILSQSSPLQALLSTNRNISCRSNCSRFLQCWGYSCSLCRLARTLSPRLCGQVQHSGIASVLWDQEQSQNRKRSSDRPWRGRRQPPQVLLLDNFWSVIEIVWGWSEQVFLNWDRWTDIYAQNDSPVFIFFIDQSWDFLDVFQIAMQRSNHTFPSILFSAWLHFWGKCKKIFSLSGCAAYDLMAIDICDQIHN